MRLPLSIPFIDSRGIEGIQLLSGCLHPCLPIPNQPPQGERQHLLTAVSSLKCWRPTHCAGGACWLQQVSCLLGVVNLKAATPRVRARATPRARTGNAQNEYFSAVRLQITFRTQKASSVNTVLLDGRAFAAAVCAVTSVSVICLRWHQKSRRAWLRPTGLSPYLCTEDACSGRWGMRLNSPMAGARPVQTECTEAR